MAAHCGHTVPRLGNVGHSHRSNTSDSSFKPYNDSDYILLLDLLFDEIINFI